MSSNDFAPIQKLLPLRVNSVDNDYKLDIEKLVADLVKINDPLWTHFPRVSSTEGVKLWPADDLIIHASMFNLNMPVITGMEINTRRVSQPFSILSVDKVLDLVISSFVIATKNAKNAAYITPSNFVIAAIEYINKHCDDENLVFTSFDGYLRVNSEVATGDAKKYLSFVLCLLRELFYRSHIYNPQKPKLAIAINGRNKSELRAPIPYTANDPKLDLGPGFEDILRYIDLHRPMHTMVLGASGTGKTYSKIIPFLKAFTNYKLDDDTLGAAFVVDPKHELSYVAEDFLTKNNQLDRYFLVGKTGRLGLFPISSSLSLNDRVETLLKATNMSIDQVGDSGPWIQKSIGFLQSFTHAHAVYFNKCGRDLYVDLLHSAGKSISESNNYWINAGEAIKILHEGEKSIKWMHQRLSIIANGLNLSVDEKTGFELLSRFVFMDNNDSANQISYVTGNLGKALNMFSDNSIASWIDISPVPEMNAHSDNDVHEIKALIDDSKIIVFQPNNSPSHDVFTRLLKAQFYSSAMERENLRQPVLFLCDEFQRFITGDQESGEASFLDRCRAYRITAVLGTQSITAMCDALAKQSVGGDPLYAVHSILPNIARMFYFQTLDRNCDDSLRRMLPTRIPHGWDHPVNIVPLSTLEVGETYYILPSGKWGRTQIKLSA